MDESKGKLVAAKQEEAEQKLTCRDARKRWVVPVCGDAPPW